jgi:hypothetical protein
VAALAIAAGVNQALTTTTKLPLFLNRFAKVWPNRRRHQTSQLARSIDSQRITAMTELTGMVGFSSQIATKRLAKRHTVRLELIATVALAVSLMIAATAVSIGVARARTPGAAAHGAPLAAGLCLRT